MADRYFTPREVEALIPALTEVMERILEGRREAVLLRERLKAEQQRVAVSGGAVVDREAWKADADRAERVAAAVQADLQKIAELGGVPKDLELGLVDFLHLRGGREVNLCWKYGEKEVRYWHGLDEGYAARKPL